MCSLPAARPETSLVKGRVGDLFTPQSLCMWDTLSIALLERGSKAAVDLGMEIGYGAFAAFPGNTSRSKPGWRVERTPPAWVLWQGLEAACFLETQSRTISENCPASAKSPTQVKTQKLPANLFHCSQLSFAQTHLSLTFLQTHTAYPDCSRAHNFGWRVVASRRAEYSQLLDCCPWATADSPLAKGGAIPEKGWNAAF